MKNNFLKSTALSISVVIGISIQQLKADVIVNEANPSAIASTGPVNFFLDINNNGVNDYELTITSSAPFTITIVGLNAGNMIETDGSGIAIALNEGATVGNNSFETTATIYEDGGTVYYFQDQADKYLGLKFQSNGNTHYGYFEVSLDYSHLNKFLDMFFYGYESTPNQIITAGAPPTAIDPILADDFKVMINNGKVEINSSTPINRLELADISGKVIRRNIPQELSIDINGLPRQVYFLTVYDNKATRPVTVRKLVLGE